MSYSYDKIKERLTYRVRAVVKVDWLGRSLGETLKSNPQRPQFKKKARDEISHALFYFINYIYDCLVILKAQFD